MTKSGEEPSEHGGMRILKDIEPVAEIARPIGDTEFLAHVLGSAAASKRVGDRASFIEVNQVEDEFAAEVTGVARITPVTTLRIGKEIGVSPLEFGNNRCGIRRLTFVGHAGSVA